MSLPWSPDFETGIALIDAEHRELFLQIEALQHAASSGNLAHAEYTLGYLERYVLEHFENEERHMLAAGYAGLPAHREAHQGFTAEYLRRKAEHQASRSLTGLLIGLADWLPLWLEEHIQGPDMQMAQFFHTKRYLPEPVPTAQPVSQGHSR